MTQKPVYAVVIDDDPIVARLIEQALKVRVVGFTTSAAFRDYAPEGDPCAVFIDVHLGLSDSGLDLLPLARERWPRVPILVITADPRGDLVGQALIGGANDFVKKPLEPEEIDARVRARSVEMAERSRLDVLQFGDVAVDLGRDEVKGPNGAAYLSRAEMRLLVHLARTTGLTVSRPELKTKLWGSVAVSENALDRKIFEVRQALRDVGSAVVLQSAYGKGVSLHLEAPKGKGKPRRAVKAP